MRGYAGSPLAFPQPRGGSAVSVTAPAEGPGRDASLVELDCVPSAGFPRHFHKDRGPFPPACPAARPPHPCSDAPASLSATLYVLAIVTERSATFQVDRPRQSGSLSGDGVELSAAALLWTRSVKERIQVVLSLLGFGVTRRSGAWPHRVRTAVSQGHPTPWRSPWSLPQAGAGPAPLPSSPLLSPQPEPPPPPLPGRSPPPRFGFPGSAFGHVDRRPSDPFKAQQVTPWRRPF